MLVGEHSLSVMSKIQIENATNKVTNAAFKNPATEMVFFIL